MTTQYRAGEIRRSLQRFIDFANDLLGSDYNTFEDRLRDMEESLPTDKTAPVAASAIQVIHHATNVIQQTASGTGIIQHASLGIDPRLAELLFELRSTVAAGASNAADEARDSGLID